jgi:UDP-N-acetylmuramate--alanine ligase
MLDLTYIKNIFFIGIGGIGMSALARYFKAKGVNITGYDKTETALTKQLVAEGMSIHYADDIAMIPEGVELVIYTPAIPKNHIQFNYFLQHNFIVKKRSEILEILSANQFTIAIGGSHGKTSVTSMIAHIVAQSGIPCTAFLGGIATNYNSNFIHTESNSESQKALPVGEGLGGAVFIIEADEFDRSFLRLTPDIAVITAVDTDHLDIYGSKENIEEAFIQFTQKVKPNGCVIVNENVSIISKIAAKKIIYGWNVADFKIENVHYEGGELHFDIETQNAQHKIQNCKLSMNGKHNAENALAATIVAFQLGISVDKIKNALATFKGIKRRFEFITKRNDFVFIDDYAHHPEEIKRFIESVKELYADKKVTVIFQPHLFSRTNDLQTEFAAALNLADKVILLDIYPARELPVEGVTSKLIFDKITITDKVLLQKEELVGHLQNGEKPEVLCTIGAGDIDKLVQPIKALYP